MRPASSGALRQGLKAATRAPRHGRLATGSRRAGRAITTTSSPSRVRSLQTTYHCQRYASTSASPVCKDEVEDENPPLPGPSNLPASTDLLEVYRGMVAQGRLAWDEEQVRVVMKLRHLLDELTDYEPPLELLSKLPASPFSQSRRRARWWSDRKGKEKEWLSSLTRGTEEEEGRELVKVLTGEEELEGLNTPKGILLTGPPGTGKSLMLQLFFSLLPTSHKLRTHYHPFLLSLYRRVFDEMQKQRGSISQVDRAAAMEIAGKRGWRAVFAGGRWEGDDKGEMDESMAFTIAREMILEYHILYFDELQLLDASSAALLRDVLSWYWRLGGVIISCSNRVPDDLYHHGVQRERMSSFLSALKARCDVVTLDGGRDYRRVSEEEPQEKWFILSEVGDGFDQAWQRLRGEEGSRHLGVYGRRVTASRVKGTAARFTFAELCEQPLGPADYLSITSAFSTIFIDDVPVLLLKNKNEARRLINLVDALYEARCQIFIRAAAPLSTLFFPDALSIPDTATSSGRLESNEAIMAAEALSETLHAPTRPNISSYDDRAAERRETGDREDRGGVWGKLGIFTGEDERFAYKRAVSRLVEMTTSPAYAQEQWTPLDTTGRTWETKLPPSFPAMPATSCASPRPVQDRSDPLAARVNDDLATEAGYSRPRRLTSPATVDHSHKDERVIDHPTQGTTRYRPPHIREQHVWGVAEEWGKKAGKWGQGAKAFRDEASNSKSGRTDGDGSEGDGEK